MVTWSQHGLVVLSLTYPPRWDLTLCLLSVHCEILDFECSVLGTCPLVSMRTAMLWMKISTVEKCSRAKVRSICSSAMWGLFGITFDQCRPFHAALREIEKLAHTYGPTCDPCSLACIFLLFFFVTYPIPSDLLRWRDNVL